MEVTAPGASDEFTAPDGWESLEAVGKRQAKRQARFGSVTAWLSAAGRIGARLLPGRFVFAGLAVVAVLVGFWTAFQASMRPVTILVNGTPFEIRTHQSTPRAILKEWGLPLGRLDIVDNPLDEGLAEDTPLIIHKPKPIVLTCDGNVQSFYSHTRTARDLLAEVGIPIHQGDRIQIDGTPVDVGAPLPESLVAVDVGRWDPQPKWVEHPLLVEIKRAVPLTISDGSVTYSILTTASHVGQAFLEAGITVFLADRISPSLTEAIRPGMRVILERSKPMKVRADGRTIATRTREDTVADLLAQEGITLRTKDYCLPQLDEPLRSGLEVRVVRVDEELIFEDTPIEYETVWEADPKLELDQRHIRQDGQEGIERRRIRIHHEDGEETYRVEEESWTAEEPTNRVIAYGTRIVERQLDTEVGTLTYWRKLRVKATSYTPATCGKEPDHPQYGITRLGWWATKGIIAVDPRVISLRTEMYVPGYGPGTAGDTGGAIKWRRIDLCYDVENLVLWKKWVDVYLLSPPPPPDEINWIVPDWPPEY